MSHASQPSAGTPPPKHTPGAPPPRERDSDWAVGGVIFAGILLLCNGVLAILQGIAAIGEDNVYGRVGNYVYRINLTGWGWIHLIIGICLVITGYGILKNMPWARYTGIFFASISLIAQFLFLPYLPVWALIMIAIDVFIIWALAVYHPDNNRDLI
ncbi:hypothetical protein ABT354_06800 [Streptomyces sp. NPDC000594]|uniref:DUF7144 family membrane protein n=1 Tax=Streptomyces sp. NPDC000594 TaxID=3154261 RepID=UPI0033221A0B